MKGFFTRNSRARELFHWPSVYLFRSLSFHEHVNKAKTGKINNSVCKLQTLRVLFEQKYLREVLKKTNPNKKAKRIRVLKLRKVHENAYQSKKIS